MTSRLNPEDQKHVEEYLQLSQHRVERRPFRPWMLLVLVLAVDGLSGWARQRWVS